MRCRRPSDGLAVGTASGLRATAPAGTLPRMGAEGIWKLLRGCEWAALARDGRFEGSADDARDGFVHLSTGAQLAATAARHFAGEARLVAVRLAVEGDEALKWEMSRGGERFPHLYRPIRAADIAETRIWETPA